MARHYGSPTHAGRFVKGKRPRFTLKWRRVTCESCLRYKPKERKKRG